MSSCQESVVPTTTHRKCTRRPVPRTYADRLVEAIRTRDEAAVRKIGAATPTILNKPSRVGMPIRVCVSKGGAHEGVMRALLELGADPHHEDQTPSSSGGYSLFDVAVRDDLEWLVELFLHTGNLPDPPAGGPCYGTPLRTACCRGNLNLAERLLEAGADIHRRFGNQGELPLLREVAENMPVAMPLLVRLGVDPNFRLVEVGQVTALCSACNTFGSSPLKVVMTLLENGAKVEVPGTMSALDVVNDLETADLLLRNCPEFGADRKSRMLERAVDTRHWGGAHRETLHQRRKLVKFLLDRGAELSVKTDLGTLTVLRGSTTVLCRDQCDTDTWMFQTKLA